MKSILKAETMYFSHDKRIVTYTDIQTERRSERERDYGGLESVQFRIQLYFLTMLFLIVCMLLK